MVGGNRCLCNVSICLTYAKPIHGLRTANRNSVTLTDEDSEGPLTGGRSDGDGPLTGGRGDGEGPLTGGRGDTDDPLSDGCDDVGISVSSSAAGGSHKCVTFTVIVVEVAVEIIISSSKHDDVLYDNIVGSRAVLQLYNITYLR